MTTIFDPTLSFSQFTLPEQDIKLLSFCESNKLIKVKEWVEQLRLTQVNQTSVALYRAAPEIVRLKTDAKTRYDMLESLWGPTQQSMLSLSKEYLQKPLILPDKARNAAILSQALQRHFVDGYCTCIRDIINQRKLKAGQKEILLNSAARALSAIGIITLRAYQLYSNVPNKLWLRAHVLFQIIEFYDLHEDPLPHGVSTTHKLRNLKDIYLQLLTLGCVRANQLTQVDIEKVYSDAPNWVQSIQVHPNADSESKNVYIVNLSADQAPITKKRFEGSPDSRVLELDFQNLAKQLDKSGDNQNNENEWAQSVSKRPTNNLPDSLISHLLDCWSQNPERNQPRNSADKQAEVCLGMIDCHFQLCGAVEFQDFLHPKTGLEEEDEAFLSGNFDSLIASLSTKDKDLDEGKAAKQTVFNVSVVNCSPGGYCILWRGDLPNKIESGELIGVREKGRRSWSIGVIRWVKQLKQASQLGIQILSNHPVPYAAAQTFDMGGYSDYMRAIHIPNPIDPEQPPSIATPTVPFQEHSRVKLKQDGQNVDIRLGRCLFSTSKMKLFTFSTLSDKNENDNF